MILRRFVTTLATTLPFLLASLPAAEAQQTFPASGATSGITVTGRGTVRVHADELHFSATIFSNAGRGPAVPADIDGAAEAIAKALRDGGVADANAGFAAATNLTGPRAITGSLHHPTRDAIDALLKRGNAAAAPFPSVTLQNLNLNFLVDDCSEPEQRAQNAAIADAHARAERIAHAAGVRLGAPSNINEINANEPCVTRPDNQAAMGYGPSNNDASTLGDVFINVTAVVTYALAH
jgi:uncharacterized protein YggE